jgi:hypothetical protein
MKINDGLMVLYPYFGHKLLFERESEFGLTNLVIVFSVGFISPWQPAFASSSSLAGKYRQSKYLCLNTQYL